MGPGGRERPAQQAAPHSKRLRSSLSSRVRGRPAAAGNFGRQAPAPQLSPPAPQPPFASPLCPAPWVQPRPLRPAPPRPHLQARLQPIAPPPPLPPASPVSAPPPQPHPLGSSSPLASLSFVFLARAKGTLNLPCAVVRAGGGGGGAGEGEGASPGETAGPPGALDSAHQGRCGRRETPTRGGAGWWCWVPGKGPGAWGPGTQSAGSFPPRSPPHLGKSPGRGRHFPRGSAAHLGRVRVRALLSLHLGWPAAPPRRRLEVLRAQREDPPSHRIHGRGGGPWTAWLGLIRLRPSMVLAARDGLSLLGCGCGGGRREQSVGSAGETWLAPSVLLGPGETFPGAAPLRRRSRSGDPLAAASRLRLAHSHLAAALAPLGS